MFVLKDENGHLAVLFHGSNRSQLSVCENGKLTSNRLRRTKQIPATAAAITCPTCGHSSVEPTVMRRRRAVRLRQALSIAGRDRSNLSLCPVLPKRRSPSKPNGFPYGLPPITATQERF